MTLNDLDYQTEAAMVVPIKRLIIELTGKFVLG